MLRHKAVDRAGQADEWARAFHQAQPAPALSLAVAGADGPVWSAALGQANLELAVPARCDHLFRLGSVSKAITATLAARLVSRGLVDLDSAIAYWLPDLPEHHRRTTLRQLLTHRGGVRHYLPSDFDAQAPGGSILQRRYTGREAILALFIDDPLVAEPGTQVSYSSFGYTLASMVMEAAAATGFLQLVEDEIARPFGLPSLVADDVLDVVPMRASGYHSAREVEFMAARTPSAAPPTLRGGYANVTLSSAAFCWAGAGLLMAMPDLARFGASHLEGPHARINARQRALLFTPLTEATAGSPPLGLGWRVDRDAKGRLRWHHAGGTPGGRAVLVIYPEPGLAIAFASNTMMTPGDVLGPASELADLFA